MERRINGTVQRMEGDSQTISGYAAVFNSEAEIGGFFIERIAPGAFDDVLNDDVRALIDHNPSLILGRTTAGNLTIGVDDKGLRYEINPPDTQIARDLIENMRAGNITQSSFGFTVESETWDEPKDGLPIRTINRVGQLFDVSPVTYPAYEDTQVALRSAALEILKSAPIKQFNPFPLRARMELDLIGRGER